MSKRTRITAALLTCLLPLAANAGSAAPANMQAVVGSLVVPMTAGDAPLTGSNEFGDYTLSAGGSTVSFGLPVAIATLNHEALIEARAAPDSTPCISHVHAVDRLVHSGFTYITGVPVDVTGWEVVMVRSSKNAWSAHASAMVIAEGRYFLLDNGALGLNAGNWLDVTEMDRSGWQVSPVI